VPPRSRSAQIAESLEAITLKLLAKNPAHRYPSAEDLRADLRRYREGAHELARPLTPAVRPPSAVAPLGLIEAAAHTAALQPVRVGAPPRPPQRRSSTARTGTFAVLIVLVLIVLLAILILLFTDNNKSNSGASGTVAVPSLINKTRADAEKAITDAGLKVQVEEQDNAQYEVGKVFRQDPAGGTKVARDSTVRLTVSKGNSSIAVKSVIGSLADDAEQALRSQGFEVKRVPDPKSTRPENEVVAQNPVPGTTLAPGQTVTITFSSPEEKVVKDVANQTAAAAAATLARDGFEVQEKQEASDAVEPGKVIRTDPPANSKLKVGQTITIFTSSGPAQVLVPDVVGLFSPTAQQTLEQSGLIVAAKFQELPAGSPNIGRVIDQTPNGNTPAKKGATVTITVGKATTTTTTAPSATTTTSASGTPTTAKKSD
jgi:serine/threonine-protein kinase